PTFGSGGKVLTAFAPNSDDEASAVAIQRDGRIVVVGLHRHRDRFTFALARYTPTGRLDPSFGAPGTLPPTLGTKGSASAPPIQPDGDGQRPRDPAGRQARRRRLRPAQRQRLPARPLQERRQPRPELWQGRESQHHLPDLERG